MKLTQVHTKPHVNELGYQMISDEMWSYLFGKPASERPKLDKIDQAQIKAGFSKFDGYKFPPDSEPYEGFPMYLPTYSGSLIEHINQLANSKWGPVKQQLINFLNKGIPDCPTEVLNYQAGWTRYKKLATSQPSSSLLFDFGETESDPQAEWEIIKVDNPIESTLVFDVETFVKAGNGPVMAVCVSNEAWYFWLHPSVTSSNLLYTDQLINLGTGKLVLNHNPKFDSARVSETYDLSLGDQRNIWLDTMSMHMSVCGMSSKQRVPFKAYQSGSQTHASKWATKTSANSLVEVYNHHVRPLKPLTKSDKLTRNLFVNAVDVQEFRDNLDELTYYTLKDGLYTYKLGQALVPKYFKSQPSIITFGGSCILSKSFLPVMTDWTKQLVNIEKAYTHTKKELKAAITHIGKVWARSFQSGKLTMAKIKADPWMSQLDWTPGKTGPTAGLPLWYRKVRSKGISTGSQLAPLLLKMEWDGQPLVLHPRHKWIFKATPESPVPFELKSGVPGLSTLFGPGTYMKVPHKDGDKKNCGNPLGKNYIDSIEKGLLSSPNPKAAEYLKAAKSIAYWTSMRSRAFEYRVTSCKYPDGTPGKMIEPLLVAAGTTSRRCVEKLWLTVSSAKEDVIGSELKGLVRPINWDKELSEEALGHYLDLSADFDAQELKIASAYADAYLWLIFGSSPMGYTQLLGDKDKKTDGHTLLALFLAMGRPIAKNLNFQMLYLSGTKGCASTIKSQRPELSDKECTEKANAALKLRRGSKVYGRSGKYTYKGGTDSFSYNFMMALANREPLPNHLKHLQTDSLPRTPMLGSAMSEAITEENCGGDYLTSRANWGIQSSGVDILHTTLVVQDYLFSELDIDAQFQFSYHDELHNLVHAKDKLKASWALQVSHLWVWTYFFSRLGFKDLPYTYQFFSGVNLDYCFRKEVYSVDPKYGPQSSQITPSNNYEVPRGSMFKPNDLANLNPLE